MRHMRVRDRVQVLVFAIGVVTLFVGLAFVAGYVLGRVLL